MRELAENDSQYINSFRQMFEQGFEQNHYVSLRI